MEIGTQHANSTRSDGWQDLDNFLSLPSHSASICRGAQGKLDNWNVPMKDQFVKNAAFWLDFLIQVAWFENLVSKKGLLVTYAYQNNPKILPTCLPPKVLYFWLHCQRAVLSRVGTVLVFFKGSSFELFADFIQVSIRAFDPATIVFTHTLLDHIFLTTISKPF